jgi:hypothetical protein
VARGKSKGRTGNPKFGTSNAGQTSGQVGAPGSSGMNVGGITDAQARANVAGTSVMLHKQLKKNKSTGIRMGRGK